ncbi:MAG: hypothetical protein MR671_03035 [Clostridiales bacterium]|uniref:hypothetical protein n=1 Tax=Chordicoccus furentiruminis TaxID=2709410 RepID=UPI0023A7C516|nr:hypothetical protein [Chordicoccus furentiruminis]MCI6173216.1 hypothetical protein [Clostridiales bacterium]
MKKDSPCGLSFQEGVPPSAGRYEKEKGYYDVSSAFNKRIENGCEELIVVL